MTGATDNGQGGSIVLSKRSRKKSYIWEHFTVQSVGGGCRRACCKRCNRSFAYSSGSKFAGTSHLKRHIASGTCPKSRRQDKKQQLTYTSATKSDDSGSEQPKKRYRGTSVQSFQHNFEQYTTCVDIAKMIIMHEYRLNMVEDSAFITFARNLQPQFKTITVSTIESECLAIYQKERESLMQMLGTIFGRISLCLEPWTSSQTLRYMCVMGQFIDDDWRLHRRMLNFMLVSSHFGNALTDSVGACLSSWNMENKLFSITLENGSSNDGINSNLRGHLSSKNALVINGQLFVASYAHILSSVFQEGLGAIHEIIYKVHESVKYAKSLPEGKFDEVALQFQNESTKRLSLDVPTQWDTTYNMLLSALHFKQAFTYLETCDTNFVHAPSVDEWHKVETLCKYLKLLYDSANVIKGTLNPTANVYFHEAWKIKLELSQAATNEDVKFITAKMHERYEQYWKDCSLILAIAVIMDPRFKMKLVEYGLSKIYGQDASTYVRTVSDGIHDLYLEYDSQPSAQAIGDDDQGIANNDSQGIVLSTNDGLEDFDAFVSEMSSSYQPKSELDQYMEESLVPRIQNFDVLNWWRLNKLKYPTLSQMACDVLAIPMSPVSSESIFSTGNKVLDDYRSSLYPETLQALVCAKDWLQQQQHQFNGTLDESNALVKKEE